MRECTAERRMGTKEGIDSNGESRPLSLRLESVLMGYTTTVHFSHHHKGKKAAYHTQASNLPPETFRTFGTLWQYCFPLAPYTPPSDPVLWIFSRPPAAALSTFPPNNQLTQKSCFAITGQLLKAKCKKKDNLYLNCMCVCV